ncbi:MAG TPA: hypothetical protein DIV86_01360 [Alphaproteobacteria bacterium]|nr:hypothetical protein [Alphaproteobacteria bacterium]
MLQRVVHIFKSATKSFIMGFVIVYLSYFLLFGKNGIINFIKDKNQLEELKTQELSEFKKREDIKNKVERLYPKHLDADLLDEQYRRATGEIKNNEVVYYY